MFALGTSNMSDHKYVEKYTWMPSDGDLRELPRVPLRGEGSCGVGGALGTPLGLAERKRASPRGEAGTSGFLSVSAQTTGSLQSWDRRVRLCLFKIGRASCRERV